MIRWLSIALLLFLAWHFWGGHEEKHRPLKKMVARLDFSGVNAQTYPRDKVQAAAVGGDCSAFPSQEACYQQNVCYWNKLMLAYSYPQMSANQQLIKSQPDSPAAKQVEATMAAMSQNCKAQASSQ